jgi:pyridoxal phosphate enzyme (YggS family)
MSIAENIRQLRSKIPSHVSVIAISKTKSEGEIMEAYQEGHRIFGENKVQELLTKQPLLPADITWHFVGHLQSNKVKYIAPFVSMIHSVDSLKLLQVINKEAEKNNRTIPCLLQVYIAREETKFGLSEEEITKLVTDDDFNDLHHIQIAGVMGMATYTLDEQMIRNEFTILRELFQRLRENFFKGSEFFREISMGMSGDYRIAIEEGSTMVRVGTLIFGPRFIKGYENMNNVHE